MLSKSSNAPFCPADPKPQSITGKSISPFTDFGLSDKTHSLSALVVAAVTNSLKAKGSGLEYGEIDGGREDVVKVSVGDIEDRRRTKRTTKGVMSVHRTVEVVGMKHRPRVAVH